MVDQQGYGLMEIFTVKKIAELKHCQKWIVTQAIDAAGIKASDRIGNTRLFTAEQAAEIGAIIDARGADPRSRRRPLLVQSIRK